MYHKTVLTLFDVLKNELSNDIPHPGTESEVFGRQFAMSKGFTGLIRSNVTFISSLLKTMLFCY